MNMMRIQCRRSDQTAQPRIPQDLPNRRISALRLIQPALILIWLLLSLSATAKQDDTVPGSGYTPQAGEQFFLLSDSSFASDEQARVRLEAPGRDHRRYLMESYGGVDIRVYRIKQPLAFLQKQQNLHRVQVEGQFRGEGLANTLAYLWDSWYRQSRRAMQKAFSYEARSRVIEQAPVLSMGESIRTPTRFENHPQFAPIPGLDLVDQFRYPLWDAKPIAPPADVTLAGSSSVFITPVEGNVYIPIGQREPGLYVVEALVGNYRATTAVFVSNTVAITKIAGADLLVWTAHKHKGTAVPRTRLLWTDGVGLLTEGKTDGEGLLRLSHVSPERSYVLGEDAEGGVFVSENFYYDSEVYNTKLYAFTDRPLYRPGDWVEVKILGRHFKNARDSVAAASAPIVLQVIDANGTALQSLKLDFNGESGAASRFQLPANASAGGYELRFAYQDQLYSSAFRVAEYIKPHFEIVLDLAKADFRTGEPVVATLSLLYPDGEPVANANVEVSLRAQQLAMVDNELRYLGEFPVELTTATMSSDADGKVELNLPAAEKPSRYLLTVFASDGAAFRVKTSREILIERGAAQYRLTAAQRFSAVGEAVKFRFSLEGKAGTRPVSYEWLRLEDRSSASAALAADAEEFELVFAQPGTYNLSLKDGNGQILGGTAHAVSGAGLKASPGSIEIVFDQAEYAAGAVAEALITFPEPVSEALLTLERDRVENTALLSEGANWLALRKLNETQYRARIPVSEFFAPNLTFSVLYTKSGDYSFQNAGIKVIVPDIQVAIRTDREVYQPGELVTVDLETRIGESAVPARLTVSVVDEMIYALQPEIAPTIGDFFYHPRRNNVRTTASLSFISYDVALPGSAVAPSSSNRSERGVKVLERPRREEVDTAAWLPDLVTDEQGRARFSFRMPDSLTRWRITARAINVQGVVGQRTSYLRSEKPLYLKFSGPTRFRTGDAPVLGLLAFNQGETGAIAQLRTQWAGQQQTRDVRLPKGVSYQPLELAVAEGELVASLVIEGAVVDQLAVSLHADGQDWLSLHSRTLGADSVTETLPVDARAVSLRLQGDSELMFQNALDDLLAYPWGCVEQTASRLLPLSLAYPRLARGEARIGDRLRLVMQNSRLRLVQMAGPNARFSWWGGVDEDPFLTAYAYYADHQASRALGLELPPEHWQRVLELYAERGLQTPLLQRALILDFAAAMDLPVQSLLQRLLTDLAQAGPGQPDPGSESPEASLILNAPDSGLGLAAARVLAARLAQAVDVTLPEAFETALVDARTRLSSSTLPFARAVLVYGGDSDPAQVRALFARIAPEQATLERSLMLSWLGQSLQASSAAPVAPPQGWSEQQSELGSSRWLWTGTSLPGASELAAAIPIGQSALLSYESAAPAKSNLPVTIERQLWRLIPGEGAFKFQLQAVEPGSVLDSGSLYLDEILLRSSAEKPLRYGLVEVPLPPGADVERTTWGISITGLAGAEAAPLEKARHEPGQLRYAVPVDTLVGEVRFRHLVRFSTKGSFELPPARYHRMYAPQEQAFETAATLAKVQVQ